jgi:hypothetical protein
MTLIPLCSYATNERGNQTIMNKAKRKLTLSQPATYQIKVPGEIDEKWMEWAGSMTITVTSDNDSSPITILTGTFDHAALQGLLCSLYFLGLPLISVIIVEDDSEEYRYTRTKGSINERLENHDLKFR